ncbi:unnamed protein product [Pleuronectes platessa]|uniref:Uncharacterized protein n=1 Tax=Pleuronectes platessa TaxID=8262 RepID=A0A9N7VCV6_PLEPL|nr:unnamed protein product [Pleuronectes platessa]
MLGQWWPKGASYLLPEELTATVKSVSSAEGDGLIGVPGRERGTERMFLRRTEQSLLRFSRTRVDFL